MGSPASIAGWGVGLIVVVVAGAWMLARTDGGAHPTFEGGVELVYRPHIDAARTAGTIGEGETDDVAYAQTMYALQDIVRRFGISDVHVRREGDEYIVLTIGEAGRPKLDEIMAAVRAEAEPSGPARRPATASFELRIIVEPWDEARVRAPELPEPQRLWAGNALEFQQFRDEEVLLWQMARSDDTPYVPSREDLYVVKKQGAAGDTAWDFVVVSVPAGFPGHLLGLSMLENPRVSTDERRTAVVFDVKPPYRNMLHDFMSRHRGLQLAIIVDEQLASHGVIMAPMNDSFTLFLSAPGHAAQAERLALALEAGSSGPLRVVCGFVEQRERG